MPQSWKIRILTYVFVALDTEVYFLTDVSQISPYLSLSFTDSPEVTLVNSFTVKRYILRTYMKKESN
jgi:hypothetical protein